MDFIYNIVHHAIKHKIPFRLLLLKVLLCCHLTTNAQDTSPPVITSPARDTSFECGITSGLIDKLTFWYNNAGGAIATDDSGTVTWQANLSLSQAITIFNNSLDVLCGNKQKVDVVFTAVDPSGNLSAPTTASFFTTDTKGPRLLNAVSPVQYNCMVGIRDTMISWIQKKAGYTASDDCSNSVNWKNFNYAITHNNVVIQSGGGSIANGPYPMIPDGICMWKMNISFIVADECGNETGTPGTTSFSVTDNVAPVFNNPPQDVTVDCNDIPPVPVVTVTDYCDKSVIPVFTETSTQLSDTTLCGHFNYTINRKWTALDECGNASEYIQTIIVQDIKGPVILANPSASISCLTYDLHPDSLYIRFSDQCSKVFASFKDTLITAACTSGIDRNYSLKDVCGNTTTYIQHLNILQQVPPRIIKEAQNQEYSCSSQENLNALLGIWIQNQGLSLAEPVCGPLSSFAAIKGSYDINNPSTFPGTFPSSLPPQQCPSLLSSYLRYLEVDFVYFDSCGNAAVTTGIFGIKDDIPPVLSSCPSAINKFTSLNSCTADVTIQVPVPTDDCIEASSPVVRKISEFITSSTTPGPEAIVDPVLLKLGPFNPTTANPLSNGIVEIKLNNLDIDDVTEFFNIIDEDGNNLGQTPVGAGQCASTSFSLILPQNKINVWIQDGYIDLLFDPNILNNPVLSINNICSNASIEATISYEIDLVNTVKKSYRVNQGPAFPLTNEENIHISLPPGSHHVVYAFTDCAGNVAECAVPVNVIDNVPPVISCPSDIITNISVGQCLDTVELQINFSVSENCNGASKYNKVTPQSAEASLISFRYNENTGKQEARSKELVFTGVFPIRHLALPVQLKIRFFGNNILPGEYFDILGPGGYLIGSTSLGQGQSSCSLTETVFEIDHALFNSWISNGQFTVLAVPKNGGDGINPCSDLGEGQSIDHISYINAELLYSDASFSISSAGATVIPDTNIPAGTVKYNLILNAGLNIISLKAKDGSDNVANCDFNIHVKDIEAPVAKCKNTVITLHPSGLEPAVMTPEMINNGSRDNCTISKMLVVPASIDCSSADSDVQVSLIVEDGAGNKDTCMALVRVKSATITPTYSAGLCTNDTLKLFANVPPASIGGTYSFHWDGPGNIEFFTENPFIPNADESFNGVYVLTVKGFNNCTSVGSVLVNIKPLTNPELTPNSKELCENDDLILTTTSYSGNIDYQWFEGIFPNGILLRTTSNPEFILKPDVGVHFYYVIAKGPDCSSNASSLLKVTILKTPEAIVNNAFLTPCDGDDIILGTPVNNTNFTYLWTGPAGYNEQGRSPRVITNASALNAGDYFLTIRNGNCFSDTAVTKVVILERPAKPVLLGADIFCEGVIFSLSATLSPTAEKYEWYLNDVLFTITQENSLIIPNAQSGLQGTWTVIAVKGNCKSAPSAPKSVAIDSSLEIGVINSGPVCMGDSVRLQATFVPNAVYTWNGPGGHIPAVFDPLIPGVPGDYSVTITTPTGCQNNASTTVTVISVPEITALSNDSRPCLNSTDVIRFFPSVFPNSNNYVYEWKGPSNFISSQKNPLITNLSAKDTGTYQLIIYNEGCPSNVFKTDVFFNINPPQPSISGPAFVCTGQQLTVHSANSAAGDTYRWNTPLGSFITQTDSFSVASATISDAGIYSLEIIKNGCTSPETAKINIEIRNTPETPFITGESPVCFGDTIQLFTSKLEGAQYLWTGPANGTNSNELVIPDATDMNSGQYMVVSNINGCVSKPSAPFELMVRNKIKVPDFESNTISVCKSSGTGAEICFKPNSLEAGAIYHIFNSTNGNTLAKGNNICFIISDISSLSDGANFLVARAEVGNCFSDVSLPLLFNINTPPSIEAQAIENDFIVCPEEIVRLMAASGPPLVDVHWTTINPQIIISDPTSVSPLVSGLNSGENTIYLDYSIAGCRDFSRDTVRIYVEFEPQATNDTYILAYGETGILPILQNDILPEQSEVSLVSLPEHGTVTVNGNLLTYVPDTRFLETVTFTYKICAGYCNDLCSEATVVIEFDDDILCKAPNIFTPNGDGINDNFIIPCLESNRFPDNKLMIFNEWGTQVYFAGPYTNDWEGTFGGNPLPAGTYFYIMDTGDGQRPVNGFLILQR